MAPNTNFKAVALFGVSAKDLQVIGASPNVKHTLANIAAPQEPTLQQATSQPASTGQIIDSDSYWEDPADADTLWHYHGVTAARMGARRDALASVLERMQQRKAFELEAAQKDQGFGASNMVEQLKQDAVRRQQEQTSAAAQVSAEHDSECYWDEAADSDSAKPVVHGRVALSQADTASYWNEAPCAEEDEEAHELTAEQMAQRHEAILRVQEACRLRSRLQEYATQVQQQELFSANHIVHNLQLNAVVAPVGSAGASQWDW